jgi:hypothetical protein
LGEQHIEVQVGLHSIFVPTNYSRGTVDRVVSLADIGIQWIAFLASEPIETLVETEVRRRDGLEGAQVSLGHAKADVTQLYAERNTVLAEMIAAEVG